MQTSAGKIFIAVLLGVGLALGGTTWLKSRSGGARAQTKSLARGGVGPPPLPTSPQPSAAHPAAPAPNANQAKSATTDNPQGSNFDQGYRAGYQDPRRDC